MQNICFLTNNEIVLEILSRESFRVFPAKETRAHARDVNLAAVISKDKQR